MARKEPWFVPLSDEEVNNLIKKYTKKDVGFTIDDLSEHFGHKTGNLTATQRATIRNRVIAAIKNVDSDEHFTLYQLFDKKRVLGAGHMRSFFGSGVWHDLADRYVATFREQRGRYPTRGEISKAFGIKRDHVASSIFCTSELDNLKDWAIATAPLFSKKQRAKDVRFRSSEEKVATKRETIKERNLPKRITENVLADETRALMDLDSDFKLDLLGERLGLKNVRQRRQALWSMMNKIKSETHPSLWHELFESKMRFGLYHLDGFFGGDVSLNLMDAFFQRNPGISQERLAETLGRDLEKMRELLPFKRVVKHTKFRPNTKKWVEKNIKK